MKMEVKVVDQFGLVQEIGLVQGTNLVQGMLEVVAVAQSLDQICANSCRHHDHTCGTIGK